MRPKPATLIPILLVVVILSQVKCQDKKNVLFISIDDLRPEIDVFLESPEITSPIYTPNINELVSRSLVMKQAFVQQALCGPSRASYLTGRRPSTTKVHNNAVTFREVGGNFTTIPQYFKDNGYISMGMGKIFHHANFSTSESEQNDPLSWSEPYFVPRCWWRSYHSSWEAVSPEQTEDCPLPDVDVADHAISSLARFAPGGDLEGENFFMAVGFYKPHLPFVFPEEYLDLYPLEDIVLANNPYAPIGLPDVAWYSSNELRLYVDIINSNYTGAINDTLPDETARLVKRAYYATVSYIDDQVGRLLSQLRSLGFEDNTIVSVIGDHGWKLGEHGAWTKQCNLELSVHAPMMIHIPGMTDQGFVTSELTELVDLFPTLVEAAGLPVLVLCPEDSSLVYACTEGMSLMPLITEKPEEVMWKESVFSWYHRNHDDKLVMGHTMRTDQFRYTEWPVFDEETYEPNWDILYGVELYDHHVDPDENHNLVDDPFYGTVRDELSAQLRAGWREALP